jgi:hypothetical protein
MSSKIAIDYFTCDFDIKAVHKGAEQPSLQYNIWPKFIFLLKYWRQLIHLIDFWTSNTNLRRLAEKSSYICLQNFRHCQSLSMSVSVFTSTFFYLGGVVTDTQDSSFSKASFLLGFELIMRWHACSGLSASLPIRVTRCVWEEVA